MKKFRHLLAMAFIFVVGLVYPAPAFGFIIGYEHTFGADGYNGNKASLTPLHIKVDQENVKWLDFVLVIDEYDDNFTRKAFFSFEPQLRIYAEKEAGIALNYRLVPRTDDFSSNDVGVNFYYLAYSDIESNLQKTPLIEEVEVSGSVRRKWFTDRLDSNFNVRGSPLNLVATEIEVSAEIRNANQGSLKPNLRIALSHDFYDGAVTGNDRQAPITSLMGFGPLTQGYLGTVWNFALFWNLGRMGGFLIEPRLSYSYVSFEGAGTANAYGASLTAGAAGYGVKAAFEFLAANSRTREFLTLGASVNF